MTSLVSQYKGCYFWIYDEKIVLRKNTVIIEEESFLVCRVSLFLYLQDICLCVKKRKVCPSQSAEIKNNLIMQRQCAFSTL